MMDVLAGPNPGILAGLAILAPFTAAILILVTPARLAEFWGYVASVVTALATVLVLRTALAGDTIELAVLPLVPGLDLLLRIDALGLLFGALASGLWIVTGVYSGGYARATDLENRQRYFASFAASIGAAMGVAFSGNLLTFFLFYELLTLATYPLVAHSESEEAFAAGRRYLLFSLGGGLALLTATIWAWNVVGTLDFTPGGFLNDVPRGTAIVLFALLVTGVAVKSAVMPLHAWLPAAMVAPTPVSALLHAVAVVKAGVFGMMRVLAFVFGPVSLAGFAGPEVLAALAAATIVIGSLIAVRQDNLKRRLAYSTVVHLSYIVLGAALVAPFGLTGAALHMVNHGLAKITLFFCAGAIYATAHRTNVSELAGLGHRMPWTFGAFTVASLGLIGIPGMSGFISKFFLARGAIEAGDWVALVVMLGASLLTATYLLPIVRVAFFPGTARLGGRSPRAPRTRRREASPALLVPLLITALLVVVFGLFPPAFGPQFDLAAGMAARVFGGAP
jgi:multicomponent Na+:H+ antiporter subunit D